MPLVIEIISLVLVLILAAVGGVKYVNSQVENTRRESKKDTVSLRREIKEDIEDLHTRINKTRDEYVHSDHLDKAFSSMRVEMNSMIEGQKQVTTRMDAFLLALTQKHGGNK